jgi:hypothetical protein
MTFELTDCKFDHQIDHCQKVICSHVSQRIYILQLRVYLLFCMIVKFDLYILREDHKLMFEDKGPMR